MPRNINAPFNKICGKSATMVYRKISILQSVEVYTVVWPMAMGGLRGMSSLQLLCQSANRKSANSTKNCTTLSQNSPISNLFYFDKL